MDQLLKISRQLVGRLTMAAFASTLALIALPANAGIAATKHNLSTSGPAGANKVTAGTDEICVFCHTPHAANTAVNAPLWNKALPGTTYSTYPSVNAGTTIDGQILSVGSISLACLSCHDGTQAMDNIINAPGSGGWDNTGGGSGGLGYTWTGPSVDATGRMTNAAGSLAMLGSDLTNDHPIGIHYCGGGPTSATPTGACVDTDFFAAQNATINGNLVWWVDTAGGTPGSRDKSDMILYTRTFGANTAPSVECGSCHDPHVQTGTGTPAAGQTFLRIANTGSAVCLACHNK